MNVRIKEATTGKIWVVDCVIFGLGKETNKLMLTMPDTFYDFLSTEQLKSIDNINYDEWTKQIAEHNYVDLSNSGYEFEQDKDDDEDG